MIFFISHGSEDKDDIVRSLAESQRNDLKFGMMNLN
jgi:hypothetical protein